MSKPTPQQIDRALTIGEKLVDLAADVWRVRKNSKRKPTKRNKKSHD